MTDEAKKQFEARAAIMKDALEVFRKAGAQLVPVELPEFPVQAINFILSAEAAAAFDDLTRIARHRSADGAGPGRLAQPFRTLRFVPAVEYIRAQRARTLLMRKIRRADVEGATCSCRPRAARASRRPT